MTNFEKAKNGLDVVFNDISLNEPLYLYENIDCIFCKIQDKCSELMEIAYTDDDYGATNNMSCSDVLRLYLQDETDEGWVLDKNRILNAYEQAKEEKIYDYNEAWKIIGV